MEADSNYLGKAPTFSSSSSSDASLNAAFRGLEEGLRPVLGEFLAQRGLASARSNDVRAMLGVLASKWDDSGGTNKRESAISLPGSPLTSVHFSLIQKVLNYYHHSSKTHWQVIEQGFAFALAVVQALQEYAGIETGSVRENIEKLWAAAKAERHGDYAYDTSVKIAVEDWPWASVSSAYQVRLKGVPPDTTKAQLCAALKLQDFDIPEDRVDVSGKHFIVTMNSEADCTSLVEMKQILIRRVQVSLSRVVGASSAVALYLPRELELETIANAWDNEHYDLDRNHISYDGVNQRVVLIQITPAKLAKLKNRCITLLRQKIDMIEHGPYRLRFHFPSEAQPCLEALATSLSSIVNQADIVGLSLVSVSEGANAAVVHLRSSDAYAKVLKEKHLVIGNENKEEPPAQVPVKAQQSTPSIGSQPPPSPASKKAKAKKGEKASATPPPSPSRSAAQAAKGKEGKKDKSAEKKEQKAKGGEQKPKPFTKEPKAVLILQPVPPKVDAQTMMSQFAQQFEVELNFVTIRGNQAYIEVQASQVERIAAVITINGSKIKIVPYEGNVPYIKVGLSPSLPNLPKGQVTQAVINAFVKQDAGRLGSIFIGPDAIHVPVSTKACLKRLLQVGIIDVLGNKLRVFDASSIKHEEILKDVLTMHYLKKERDDLDRIQEACHVTITLKLSTVSVPNPTNSNPRGGSGKSGSTSSGAEAGRGRGRGKGRGRGDSPASSKKDSGRGKASGKSQGGGAEGAVTHIKGGKGRPKEVAEKSEKNNRTKTTTVAVVRIKGENRDQVDAALRALRDLIERATVKKSSFKFDATESALCHLLEEKVKELGRKEEKIAVFCSKKPDGTALEVSLMGIDKAAVEHFNTRPNHIRNKLTIKTIQIDLRRKKIDVKQLSKAYNVAIKLNPAKREITVAGPRESVKACLATLTDDTAQLTLTAGSAVFFQQYLRQQFTEVQVSSVKKRADAILLKGSSEDIDSLRQLTDKLQVYQLPYYVSSQLAELLEYQVRVKIEELGIAAVVVAQEASESDTEDDSDDEEEEDDDDDDDEDLKFFSLDSSEDEWLRIEVWSLGVIPSNILSELCGIDLNRAVMPFFPSELGAVKRLNLSLVKSKFAAWTQLDLPIRTITCFSFSPYAADDALMFISEFLSKGNSRSPRAVYSLPLAFIAVSFLTVHEIPYLTFTCRDQQMVAIEETPEVRCLIQDKPLLFLLAAALKQ